MSLVVFSYSVDCSVGWFSGEDGVAFEVSEDVVVEVVCGGVAFCLCFVHGLHDDVVEFAGDLFDE